ncbi:MAG: hypothetical protein JNM22_12080 [Saprospiraceae bacterium]|nr:hypothetical protein [Saprospiraceae bacterium]
MYKNIIKYIENNIILESKAEDLAQILSNIRRTFNILDLVKDILNNEMLCNQIAANSYFHYNGFDKIILYESEVCKLRLHIWWGSNIEYKENVHDHRWNFASWIVKGKYINEIYTDNDNFGNVFSEYHYKPRDRKEKQSYPLEFIRQTKLKKDRIEELSEGMITKCETGTLHRVKPITGINTVTLFLQSSSVLSYARVLNQETIIDSDNIQAISMQPDYLVKQLNKLITIL